LQMKRMLGRREALKEKRQFYITAHIKKNRYLT